MSRITNLKTIRLDFFGYWYSQWYEKEYYDVVTHQELNIRTYLSGIFYRLKLLTNYFFIKRLLNGKIFISSDVWFYKKPLQSNIIFKEQTKYCSFLMKHNIYLQPYLLNYLFELNNINAGTRKEFLNKILLKNNVNVISFFMILLKNVIENKWIGKKYSSIILKKSIFLDTINLNINIYLLLNNYLLVNNYLMFDLLLNNYKKNKKENKVMILLNHLKYDKGELLRLTYFYKEKKKKKKMDKV